MANDVGRCSSRVESQAIRTARNALAGCGWRKTWRGGRRNKLREPVEVELGNSYAKWRIFTREDKSQRRVYRFRDEQHGVTGPTLRRQFLASEPR